MMSDMREKIFRSIEKMPSLSPTLAKIVTLSNDPNASPKDLMQVIKYDPVLTVKVLKLVNSAYFGLNKEIISLNRALILLGVNTIKNLALSTAVLVMFPSKSLKVRFNMDMFWEHSLGCAVSSKLIADEIRIEKKYQEEYFISGLLHDIGKVVLAHGIPDEYERVLKQTKEKESAILEVEREILDMDHTEAGALLCRRWKLQEPLVESIKNHHLPEKYEELDNLALSVYIGNCFCKKLKIGFSGDNFIWKIKTETLKKINLNKEQITNSLEKLPSEIDKAKIFLQT